MFPKVIVQHAQGVLGQVFVSMPLLSLTIYLANFQGLEEAGNFTIVVALSAIFHTASLWGLRSHIVLNRLKLYPVAAYSIIRLTMAFLAVVATTLVAFLYPIAHSLIAFIVCSRACDALIDLRFGFDQVQINTHKAISNFMWRHLLKFASLLGGLIGMIGWGEALYRLEGTIAFMLLIYHFYRVLKECRLKDFFGEGGVALGKIWAILASSGWYALSSIVCAMVSSLPRSVVDLFFSGTNLGVVGVTLSICTFFGMAFNVSWTRAMSNFSTGHHEKRAFFKLFFFENMALLILVAIGGFFIAPQVVGIVFGFRGEESLLLSRNIMLCSAVFFAGQVFSNIFKISEKPWAEIVSYFLGGMVPLAIVIFCKSMVGFALLLAASGVTMLSFSILYGRALLFGGDDS